MSTFSPTVAAIIPVYNGSRFLDACLKSVLQQTRPLDEIIVIDDGSTDDSRDAILSYCARNPSIRLFSKANGGQSSARNFGIRQSKSDLIALLDQDDVWYPDHIQRLIEPFLSGDADNLGWTYSDVDKADLDGTITYRSFLQRFPKIPHPKVSLDACLRQEMLILPSAALISRNAFDSVGGFDEALKGYEDDDLFLRIFVAGYKNIYIDAPLSQWRENFSSTSFSPKMRKSRLNYFHKLLEQFPERPRLISARFFWIGLNAYLSESIRESRNDVLFVLSEDMTHFTHRLPLAYRGLHAIIRPCLHIPLLNYFLLRALTTLNRLPAHDIFRALRARPF
jgi:glycosyltransferase involved in cell wall biosynthesis